MNSITVQVMSNDGLTCNHARATLAVWQGAAAPVPLACAAQAVTPAENFRFLKCLLGLSISSLC